MGDRQRKRASEIQSAIRVILFREWDPIGVKDAAPADEYDCCIGDVYRILTSSRSEDELTAYLAKAETEHIGVNRPAGEGPWRDRLKQVARKLLALDVKK